MRRLNIWIRIPLILILSLVSITGLLFLYLAIVAIDHPPKPANTEILNATLTQLDTNCYVSGNNWIRKNRFGLWEMYVEGGPFERGVMNGKLSKELIHEQEEAFSEQINKLVPSGIYRHFLKYLIAWFNRDLDEHINEENKLEIYGVSRSASSEFDYVGSAYQRMMNYHAAHDIGHALQNLALVGCSSFATWNDKSDDNQLIIGRNFDFFVGDRFAENKIVLFMKPDSGYRFMMVTWGGFTGVVSGMNMEGLTVTLNAAKSKVPSGSATPVSLLGREILQYAKNIDEAINIVSKRRTFVSESFLIGSATDNKAVSIEVTPDTFAVYATTHDYLICTNHYESEFLGNILLNSEHKIKSASGYRAERISELVQATSQNTPENTAAILRDQQGLQGKFIGYGNEKAINQLLCHHSIIFEPQRKIVWISTDPWQLGAFVGYHLDSVFEMKGLQQNREIIDTSLTIPSDPFLKTDAYRNYVEYRKIKTEAADGNYSRIDKLIQLNPEYYDAYFITGNYYLKNNDYKKAALLYEQALRKEIASEYERDVIKERLELCRKKLKT